MENEFSYDATIAQVENIIKELQDPGKNASIDQMLGRVESANKLLDACQEYLRGSQEKLGKILAGH